MLLPAVLLAPFTWAGINPVAVYNVTLLAALALSGFTAFLLAQRLTHSLAASIVAGTIYAFAPSRFTHYMHLELQIVLWIPLALLLIHRIVEEGRLRDGMLLGVVVTAQAFSSVYTGVFLATYCALFVPLLIGFTPSARPWRVVGPLALASALTLGAVAPYALVYVRAGRSVGTRTVEDVRRYSSSMSDYRSAPRINRLYGWTSVTDPVWADERNLFPGLAALALGGVGIAAAAARTRFAYLGGLIFAFELSRGANGAIYPLLFQYLPPFRALRSPARINILVVLSLAILAAYGVKWLLTKAGHPVRWRVAGAAIVAILLVEYASAPDLTPVPPPSAVDSWLAEQPPAVIVELPLASSRNGGQSRDWLYMYQGLSHRHRMLNGYSGFAPASYYAMLDAMESFPDDRSMDYLNNLQVDYVILRGELFGSQEWATLCRAGRNPSGPDACRSVLSQRPAGNRAR